VDLLPELFEKSLRKSAEGGIVVKGIVRLICFVCFRLSQILSRLVNLSQECRKRMLCIVGVDSRLHPSSRIHNSQKSRNAIVIGPHCDIAGELSVLGHGGSIEIGEYSFVSENTRIWSAKRIAIGNKVLISHNVNIHDTNSHSLSANKRHEHYKTIRRSGHPAALDDVKEAAINISDNVWIGFNVTILAGVTIGEGAVVGACSVVTKDVPPYTVVVGNPARAVGRSFP